MNKKEWTSFKFVLTVPKSIKVRIFLKLIISIRIIQKKAHMNYQNSEIIYWNKAI